MSARRNGEGPPLVGGRSRYTGSIGYGHATLPGLVGKDLPDHKILFRWHVHHDPEKSKQLISTQDSTPDWKEQGSDVTRTHTGSLGAAGPPSIAHDGATVAMGD